MAEIEDIEEELEDVSDETLGIDDVDPLPTFFTRTRLIIGGVIALVVILVGAFFLFRGNNGAEKNGLSTSKSQLEFSNRLQSQKKKKKRKKKKIKYETLYKQLTGKQITEVVRELAYKEIPYNVIQNGKQYDIAVDKDREEDAKHLLAIKGLPSGGAVGWGIFDEASNLGVTEFDKRVRLIRAISGQMKIAIMKLDAVDDAQVEIVIPEAKLFAKTQPPVTASILIRKAEDSLITDTIVYAIVQLVSNAVENLSPKNVSVIDTQGNVLSSGIVERITERSREEKLKKIKGNVSLRPKKISQGQIIEPSMDDILEWFQLKTGYEAMLEEKAHKQLSGVLPEGTYKVAINTDLNPTKNKGAPEVKKIVVSIVIDNDVEDVNELDKQTKNQIVNAVAGAIGFEKGRDKILLSRADFVKPAQKAIKENLDKSPIHKVSKNILVVKLEDKLFKYWPIPAMGGGVFLILYALIKGLIATTKKIKQYLPGAKEIDILDDEEEVELFEEKIPEQSIDNEKVQLGNDSQIEKINQIADQNPEIIAKLLSEWIEEEVPVNG